MAFLTDRSLATGVTLQDLIHIVITGDTSQNSAGSSYKATIQQVSDAILSGFTGNTQLYEVGSGTDSTQRVGVNNDASGDYSVVSGGKDNVAIGNYSAVNSGSGNTANNDYSFIGSGFRNTSSGYYSTISGGWYNTSSGYSSNIGGGKCNTAICCAASISGGERNKTIGDYNFIGGGALNTTSSNSSTIVGGFTNKALCDFSTISGGYCNSATNSYSFVGGGQNNTASGIHSVVVGGQANSATSFCNFIGGGGQNTATGFRTTISGGRQNTTSSTYSTISGGWCNKAICTTSTIAGGRSNSAFGDGSSILGGINNTAFCNYGTILGGSGNTINHELSAAYGKDVISKSACTFHVNYLALQNTPETDSTNNNVLVRDTTTGVVKTRNISTTLHNYGSFYSVVDQPIGSIGTTYVMSAETTSFTNGISLSNGGRYTLTNGGVYNIQFSSQLEKNSGTKSIVFIWLYKNGSNVPQSNTEVTVDGANGDRVVAAWNFVESFNSGEYFEIRWTATQTNTFLSSVPSPTYGPEIPSVILTITQVA